MKSTMIVKKSIQFLVLTALAGMAFSAQAKDIAAGKAKADAACAACHGERGEGGEVDDAESAQEQFPHQRMAWRGPGVGWPGQPSWRMSPAY